MRGGGRRRADEFPDPASAQPERARTRRDRASRCHPGAGGERSVRDLEFLSRSGPSHLATARRHYRQSHQLDRPGPLYQIQLSGFPALPAGRLGHCGGCGGDTAVADRGGAQTLGQGLDRQAQRPRRQTRGRPKRRTEPSPIGRALWLGRHTDQHCQAMRRTVGADPGTRLGAGVTDQPGELLAEVSVELREGLSIPGRRRRHGHWLLRASVRWRRPSQQKFRSVKRRLAARRRPHHDHRRALDGGPPQNPAADRGPQQPRLPPGTDACPAPGQQAYARHRPMPHRHHFARALHRFRQGGARHGRACGRTGHQSRRPWPGSGPGDQGGKSGRACLDRRRHSRQVKRAMRAQIIALCVMLTLATGSAVAQDGTAPPAAQIEHGHALYVANGCFECHGTVGQGSRVSGPRLAPHTMPPEPFLQVLRHPISDMPPYVAQVLSDADARDIHAYLNSLPGPIQRIQDIPALNH